MDDPLQNYFGLFDIGCTRYCISLQHTLFNKHREVTRSSIRISGKDDLHAGGQRGMEGLVRKAKWCL